MFGRIKLLGIICVRKIKSDECWCPLSHFPDLLGFSPLFAQESTYIKNTLGDLDARLEGDSGETLSGVHLPINKILDIPPTFTAVNAEKQKVPKKNIEKKKNKHTRTSNSCHHQIELAPAMVQKQNSQTHQ